MTYQTDFSLKVHVDVDDWAYVQRRAKYLEAVLVQVLHDRDRIQEWFSAAALAELGLPGLPKTKAGLTRLAKASNWQRRGVTARGGNRYEYHFTSLPSRAFDALIARIVDMPMYKVDTGLEAAPVIPVPPDEPLMTVNTAPPWVLPFMRLLKRDANADLGKAWQDLPKHVPDGVEIPTLEDAAEIIVRFGLLEASQ